MQNVLLGETKLTSMIFMSQTGLILDYQLNDFVDAPMKNMCKI